MSLQVWLPLNGDLHNQGLSNITINNNGALVNDNGKIGKCYNPTSSTGMLYSTDTNNLISTFTRDLSICCWVKVNSWNSEYSPIVMGGVNSTSTAWTNSVFTLCRNNTNNNIFFGVSDGSASAQANCHTGTLNTGEWYHLAGVYNGTKLRLYVNGVLSSEYAFSVTPKFSNMGAISIGARYGSGTFFRYGDYSINDIRLYNHALSSKEVKELSKGLVLHYQLNDVNSNFTTNLITSISAGGQTTINNNIVTTSGTDKDTYFTLNLSENISVDTEYTISCYTKMPPNTYWTFPLGTQSNTTLSWILKPGYNEYTFIANDISWGTNRIFMDDLSGPARTSGVQCQFYNFQLEKNSYATKFVGYGQTKGTKYDKNIYMEPDGTQWVRVFHHNNPGSGLFSQSDVWANGVYKDADRWFDIYSILSQIGSPYEFMVKQKTTSDSTEAKYRWIQNVSPLEAKWDDVQPSKVTKITTSGYTSGYGGIYVNNGNTHMVIANGTSSNWYGAIGCWTAYNGGIPGYPNTTITTGYIDLYINITNSNLGKIYNVSGYEYKGTQIGTFTYANDTPKYKISTIHNSNAIKQNSFLIGNIWSASIWFYPLSTISSGWDMLFGLNSSGGDADMKLGIWYNNTDRRMEYEANGQYDSTSVVIPSKDNWYHLVGTFDGSTLSMYLDGELKKTKSITNTELVKNNLVVGGRSTAADLSSIGSYFRGKLSDFRIYCTVLSAEDIKELYNTSKLVDSQGNKLAREVSSL